MKKCLNCESIVDDDVEKCPSCEGTMFREERTCPSCGTKTYEACCPDCGRKLVARKRPESRPKQEPVRERPITPYVPPEEKPRLEKIYDWANKRIPVICIVVAGITVLIGNAVPNPVPFYVAGGIIVVLPIVFLAFEPLYMRSRRKGRNTQMPQPGKTQPGNAQPEKTQGAQPGNAKPEDAQGAQPSDR